MSGVHGSLFTIDWINGFSWLEIDKRRGKREPPYRPQKIVTSTLAWMEMAPSICARRSQGTTWRAGFWGRGRGRGHWHYSLQMPSSPPLSVTIRGQPTFWRGREDRTVSVSLMRPFLWDINVINKRKPQDSTLSFFMLEVMGLKG